VDVVNRGYGGYNTDWVMFILDDIFKGCNSLNTPLVTIFLGANDAALPLPDGNAHSSMQHVPLSRYRENLKEIVQNIRERGVTQIVMITPPPVYEPGRKEWQVQRIGEEEAKTTAIDRTNVYTKQYAECCKEVAKELDLPVVDLWTSMQEPKGWGTLLFNDGLHFTPEGNQHVYNAVLTTINNTYPSLKVEEMPMQFPHFSEIDFSNPAASFKSHGL
jgi:lysophospholipase L1-like esterase